MTHTYRRYYVLLLAVLAALSAYPLTNGVRMLALSLANGVIRPEEYARYVIPYGPMCLALLVFAALQPVWPKLFGKRTLLWSTLVTLAVFVPVELFLESLPVAPGDTLPLFAAAGGGHPPVTISVWQSALCMISPGVVQAAALRGAAFAGPDGFYYVVGNAAFKIHYYFISFVLIAMICGVVHDLGRMARQPDAALRRPLVLRLAATATLTALCIFANTTGFFRDNSPIQTPAASVLTCLFFVALGVSAGVYAGSFLLKRNRLAGLALPVALSLAAGIVMYTGEAVMMFGTLYRFGTGWFFTGLPGVPVAPVDVLVVLLAGAATWAVLMAARAPRRRAAV